MAQKTKTELDALFLDNTSGLITPSRMRDFVDTTVHSHGSFYISTPAATTITQAGTYYKAAGTTTAGALHRFTMPADNRLTYTGTASIHTHIVVNISTTSSGNNQVLRFSVSKNGTNLTASIMEHKLTTGSDVKIMTIHADCLLATNDYLELWCTNTTSTETITAQLAYMYVMGLLCDDDLDC